LNAELHIGYYSRDFSGRMRNNQAWFTFMQKREETQ
jgi:hypothetical protein